MTAERSGGGGSAAAAVAGLFWLAASESDVGLNHTLHLGLVRFGLEFALRIDIEIGLNKKH